MDRVHLCWFWPVFVILGTWFPRGETRKPRNIFYLAQRVLNSLPASVSGLVSSSVLGLVPSRFPDLIRGPVLRLASSSSGVTNFPKGWTPAQGRGLKKGWTLWSSRGETQVKEGAQAGERRKLKRKVSPPHLRRICAPKDKN